MIDRQRHWRKWENILLDEKKVFLEQMELRNIHGVAAEMRSDI
jgi:hypothetical protein